jgi:uncharacterized protein (DUF2336 family)
VRRALAVTLKASDLLPRDVARRLAADVDSVALPVIAFSPAFTDEDLIEIVRAGSPVRQIAVAGRPAVSRDVAEVLAAEGTREAVRTLAANDNADLSEPALALVCNRFAGVADVTTALAYRQALPPAISERLIGLVSEAVAQHLISRHAVDPAVVIRLAGRARERATIDLIDQAAGEPDLAAFAASLNARKVLNASLLLRALARGQVNLFEHGLAELAATPRSRAWLMIHDAGPLGLKSIYDRAGLPPRLFPAFRAGVDTWRDLLAEGREPGGEAFQQQMLERFLTQRPNASRDDMAYLLERLDRSGAADDAVSAA